MSVQAASWVWNHSPAEGKDRLVLLALANFADAAGESWPSVKFLAQQTRIHRERTVQECLARLVATGQIVRVVNGATDSRIRGDRRPNLYRLVMTNGVSVGSIPLGRALLDVVGLSGMSDGGTPSDGHGVTVFDGRGDGFEHHGVTVFDGRGDGFGHHGVPPVGTQTVSDPSEDPSEDPSGEPARAGARPAATEEDVRRITTAWTNASGMTVTTTQWDQFADWLVRFGEEWLLAAIGEAGNANARSLKYVFTVLETWERRGGPTTQTEDRRDGRDRSHASGRAPAAGEFAAFR